ncbi:MAG: NAD-dependent dihydropyrimidine dehydrogenase subunit PreA [Deltaproteobacteria bacterium]|nr:NAD-dependent dihydropyrimidine dehydrogenase subunit PreA [Deltaproteobacteria bacterium]
MADLTTKLAGVTSPNPFWLASAPPTNTGGQVMRAFEAGWGGAVWKTLGQPVENVTSRFGALDYAGRKIMGFNNIELITDRPLETNLKEMYEVKKRFPKHALIASLMVETREEWREIIKKVEDAGSDAIELNFGCPHGMCERGMGSAVGQEPKVLEVITGWTKEFAKIPVIVKLTPNISDITVPAAAARRAGADAVSLINTIKSIIGVDLDQFVPYPTVDGKSTNGGYCGPAVKPIAMHMVGAIARKNGNALPVSGIGGISDWKDAVEFMMLGAGTVQVCTAVMHYGYRIVEDMIQGMSDYMDAKGFRSTSELVGRAIPNYTDWGSLNRRHTLLAKIHQEHCIGCNLCVVACDDGGHQCIDLNPEFRADTNPTNINLHRTTRKAPIVREEECVGCNLCSLVCPAPGAITMETVPYRPAYGSVTDIKLNGPRAGH